MEIYNFNQNWEFALENQLDAYNRTQAAYDAYMSLSEREQQELEGAEETFEALFTHFNGQIMPLA
mgnify:CR=1 FL=1